MRLGSAARTIVLTIAITASMRSPCAHAGDPAQDSDLQITGQLGVGTVVPRGRLEVQMTPGDRFGIKVASPSGRPILVIDRAGRIGVGLGNPEATLDVAGSKRGGVLVRAGDPSAESGTPSGQLLLMGEAATSVRYAIQARHDPTKASGNSINFLMSRPQSRGMPAQDSPLLGLEATATESGCAVHVRPAGKALFELDVSDGVGVTGGGTLRYGSAGEHAAKSSRKGISYLGESEAARAYKELKTLRIATFRVKSSAESAQAVGATELHLRGVTYEDAPISIRGPEGTVVVDNRITNLELALKEVNRKIQLVEALLLAAEKKAASR